MSMRAEFVCSLVSPLRALVLRMACVDDSSRTLELWGICLTQVLCGDSFLALIDVMPHIQCTVSYEEMRWFGMYKQAGSRAGNHLVTHGCFSNVGGLPSASVVAVGAVLLLLLSLVSGCSLVLFVG